MAKTKLGERSDHVRFVFSRTALLTLQFQWTKSKSEGGEDIEVK